ncbi:hypothetical protein ACF0H5_015525 [Mactra antiquata]
MEFSNQCRFIVVLLFVNVCYIASRTTVEQVIDTNDEKEEIKEIKLHVITKREAINDIQQDYPHVDGRTFRASDPIDPNGPSSDQSAPENLFNFDVASEIFQPQLGEDTPESDNNVNGNNNSNEQRNDVSESQTAAASEAESTTVQEANEDQTSERSEQVVTNVQNDVSHAGQPSQSGYSDTSRVHTVPSGSSRTQHGSRQYGHSTPTDGTGTRNSMTSRRVVLAGGGADTGSSYQQTPYYRGSTSSHNSQSSIPEVRGPYYGGQRYVDSNGHYVDAQGRHLDSTGRYYDVSGRYPDATMTRTVTYQGSSGNTDNVYRGNTGTSYSGGSGSSVGGDYDYGRSRGGRLDSTGRYIESGSSQIDPSRSRPVNSYGGTQFYSSGNTYQTTYNPITSQISSDPSCAGTNNRVTIFINDLECQDAITQIGRYVCYNYERVSTACCERCLQVKQQDNVGCEYGDRSSQCDSIRPSDCYNERNRQVCCERCNHFQEQMQRFNLPATCSYGDLTPQCQNVAQRNHLCYLPDNQRVCCATCPRYANRNQPDCQWGNQSPEFCEPFDAQGRVRLNCYRHEVRDICCSTCRSLRDRLREPIPGCEYGDYPILFYIGQNQLTCSQYIHQYGVDSCNEPSLARQCCYTCHRYRQLRG